MSKTREQIDVVSVSPSNPRGRALTVCAEIKGGILSLLWEYSANLHSEATVRRLMDDYRREIASLLDKISRLPARHKARRDVARSENSGVAP
jgi:hypothetical protein